MTRALVALATLALLALALRRRPPIAWDATDQEDAAQLVPMAAWARN